MSTAFSTDGTRIASGSRDRTVCLWDAHTGSKLVILRGHKGWVTSTAFSPDGRRLVSGSNDKTVRVWDAASGAELAALHGHESRVDRVSWSADGRRIASESADGTVRVWNAGNFACLEIIRGEGDIIAITAGAQLFPLRSLARDLETVIEDAATGKVIARFPIALRHIITHPSSRHWAGSAGNHVYIISLEGHVSPKSDQDQHHVDHLPLLRSR